jgi:DNA gyrase subunit B
MDPGVRKMSRVTIEDSEKADEVFKTLMWEDVPPRKRFIQSRAKHVINLDI